MKTSTLTDLLAQYDSRRTMDTMSVVVPFSLKREMDAHRITIRDLAKTMDITQKRIRIVRAMEFVAYLVALDYAEAIERVVAARNLPAA